METAAGIAGLVKAALVLKHGQIPASLHFEKPNPHIDFAALKLRVPVSLEAFPKTNGVRMAGVNSFGFGGSNSHVILAEPPPRSSPTTLASNTLRAWPLMLSARSEGALRASASRLREWLEAKEKSNGSSPVLPDLVYTLGARRNHHQHRLTLVAHSSAEVIQELGAYSQNPALRRSGVVSRRGESSRPGSPSS